MFHELGIPGKMALKYIVLQLMQLDLWKAILEAGREEGVVPCGLGARDTLRFEAALALYGQELSKDITPLKLELDLQ